MNIRFNLLSVTALLVLSIYSVSCNEPLESKRVRKVTFALTNDIHGHLEADIAPDRSTGGLSYLAQVIQNIKQQREYKMNEAALFVVDSGDQFQGTLMSNFDEGKAVIRAMNEIGYDAVVPGNHDYDFGPLGWLNDKVVPGITSNDPREVIKDLAGIAKFPLLSANTYYKNSIRPLGSRYSVELDSQCKPLNQSVNQLDFISATQPEFLRPYVIVKKAGVRVAFIGIDHHLTSSMTTQQNVSDLCFRNEVDSYLDVRRALSKQADIFVMLLHNGNTNNSKEATEITKAINQAYPEGVHLVAAGHTHVVHNDIVEGVYVVQNGHSSQMFGKVDLYYDESTRRVLVERTQSDAGIAITHTLGSNSNVDSIINSLKKTIEPLSTKVIATVSEPVRRSRTGENALGNILTDALRLASDTQVSFMNAGGIRTDLRTGKLTYEDLFEVLPFNNIAVTIDSMPWRVLKKILAHTIQTCGKFGALNQSGLKIKFKRTCLPNSNLDPAAKLIRVETVNGELLYDEPSGKEVNDSRSFSVATLDFVAAGGDEFTEFREVQITKTNGIARELIVQELSRQQPVLTNSTDQRFESAE